MSELVPKIIYNLTLDSKDFSLVKNTLKNSSSKRAQLLADKLDSIQKDKFREICTQLGIEISLATPKEGDSDAG